jgi:hypothetical protein
MNYLLAPLSLTESFHSSLIQYFSILCVCVCAAIRFEMMMNLLFIFKCLSHEKEFLLALSFLPVLLNVCIYNIFYSLNLPGRLLLTSTRRPPPHCFNFSDGATIFIQLLVNSHYVAIATNRKERHRQHHAH